MLKKIERLRTELAVDGWTRPAVHRLIALVEEDGIETPRERASLATLPTGPDRFLGRAKTDLTRYLEFIDLTRSPTPRATLFGLGTRDIDPHRYREHVEILAGERSTRHPRDHRELLFTDRYLPSKTHQLDDVAAWLQAYYQKLNFPTELQPVNFRGRKYFNVIALIPGKSDEKILLCDHYDVADNEHLRPKSRAQLTRDHHLSPREIHHLEAATPLGAAVPGADDNASASAALMEMGAVMADVLHDGTRPEKTIALVHLVGEELPASCLGARTYLARAKETGERIGAAIVLDMIGVDRTGRRKMQISPGRHPASLALAAEVKRAIADLQLELRPILRPYGARKSFLHQTDGIQFSRAGVPVVLLNEHLNDDRDLYRAGYHDEFDTTRLMSFSFAADVTRAALETAYRLAQPASAPAPRHRARERLQAVGSTAQHEPCVSRRSSPAPVSRR